MSLGKNIHDAFEIVADTYENVSKLMSFCMEQSSEKGEFVLSSPKFLRWKSDNETGGWLMKSFILLFQNSKDKLLKSQWRKGPIYVLEINLSPYDYKVPMINIAKFEYDDITSWDKGVSPADHWRFYQPLYDDAIAPFSGDDFNYSGFIDDAYSERYWGLKRIVGIGVPLADIKRENAYKIIFDGFQSLIDK